MRGVALAGLHLDPRLGSAAKAASISRCESCPGGQAPITSSAGDEAEGRPSM